MSENEKQNLAEKIKEQFDSSECKDPRAGTMPAGLEHLVGKKRIGTKRKWETVIKKWMNFALKKHYQYDCQWLLTDRRHVCLPNDLMIPTERETQKSGKKKDCIEVWFFQDTSGSCWHLKDRLFQAAETLPKDKFNMHFFCFDAKVFETDITSRRIYGGGGTSFIVLEDYIQKTIKKDKLEYPHAVFILTDGWGDNVKPQKPENWYWFLTEHSSKSNIPEKSKVFNLKDYE